MKQHPATTSDKSVQTDFPAAMLEEYVIKNRKRILTLLGVQRVSANSPGGSGSVLHSSWHPLPDSDSKDPVTDQNPQRNRMMIRTPTIFVVDECEANLSATLSPKATSTSTTKRHSTGDAACVDGWSQNLVQAMPSTVSLESDGHVRKTEVTDI